MRRYLNTFHTIGENKSVLASNSQNGCKSQLSQLKANTYPSERP